MRPARFLPNTKSPATPSDYTDAQWKALDGVKQKDPPLRLGAARPEFANKVMLPDGTISDDLGAVRAGIAAAMAADRNALAAFTAAHTSAIVDDTLTPAQRQQLIRLRADAKHPLGDEFEDAVAQGRFLFIVDVDFVPRIYFQAAVPGNPDVELLPAEEAES